MTRGARLVVEKDETIAVCSSDDVVRVRQAVRARAIEAGFGIVDQTKLVTAASEIARNTVDYGGGGTLVIEIVRRGTPRRSADLLRQRARHRRFTAAMTDGYTTGGASGRDRRQASIQRILDNSTPDKGTTVMLARWKL